MPYDVVRGEEVLLAGEAPLEPRASNERRYTQHDEAVDNPLELLLPTNGYVLFEASMEGAYLPPTDAAAASPSPPPKPFAAVIASSS